MNERKSDFRVGGFKLVVTGFLCVSLFTIMPGTVLSQTAFDSEAVSVIQKYIETTGGLANYETIQNRVITSRIEIAGSGIFLDVKVYQEKPNKSYTLVESDATGKMESGTDGDIVWEKSAMRGALIKEGEDRESFLSLNMFDRMIYWRKYFSRIQYEGKADVDEKRVHKLIFTPVMGDSFTAYFDDQSFLMNRMEITMNTDMGATPVVSYVDDYRDVGGVRIPYQTRIVLMGQERISRVIEIKHNVDLPADRFQIPEEIRALLKE